jgi:hypothetical protein
LLLCYLCYFSHLSAAHNTTQIIILEGPADDDEAQTFEDTKDAAIEG